MTDLSAQRGNGNAANHRRQNTIVVESLLGRTSGARVFRSTDGRFLARVPVEGRQKILGLKSSAFHDWLVAEYLSESNEVPSESAVRQVLRVLEARARFDDDKPTVYVRVGRDREDEGSSHYIDLGDSSGQAIKICASGWSIIERPSVHFWRPQGLLPLPVPANDGSIELLRPFVNLGESSFRLLVAWMAAALRPVGPYPILVIHGEQGSAKTTLAKIIRQLIDPQTAAVLAEPGSTRDLMATALNGWLLAFDNISVLPPWLSDGLCSDGLREHLFRPISRIGVKLPTRRWKTRPWRPRSLNGPSRGYWASHFRRQICSKD